MRTLTRFQRVTALRTLPSALAFALALSPALVAGCGGDVAVDETGSTSGALRLGRASDGPTGRYLGQRDFIGAKASYGYMPFAFNRAAAESDKSSDARTVQESDVFRLEGTTLYVLNPHRGLQVIDTSRPERPRLVGRVDIFGSPREMYVDAARGRAYLLVSDTPKYENKDVVRKSRVVTVDIADRAHPVVLGDIDVVGNITESRMVGDVIYVVSTEWAPPPAGSNEAATERTVVKSINVRTQRKPYQVAEVAVGGSAYQIHATSSFLFVARYAAETTEIEVFDISSPRGQIVQRAQKAVVQGHVRSRFDLNFAEGARAGAGVLRVVTHRWNDEGTIFVSTFTVAKTDAVTPLGSLELPAIGSLLATKFDGDKAYLVHMVRVDPLDVIDLSNPAQPTRLSSLVIPGWLEKLEVRGNRVVGIGMDNASGRNQVTVAMYDVADPTATREIARVALGSGDDWQWTNFSDDRAFRLIDEKGLLLVPYSTYSQTTGSTNALQLVDVNLTRGTLAARGSVQQRGDVSRAFPLQANIGSFSFRQLAVTNIDNRDAPRALGDLELARNIASFTKLSNVGLQLVSEWDGTPPELRAVPIGDADAEKVSVLSTLKLTAASYVLPAGQKAIVVSHAYPNVEGEKAKLTLTPVDYSSPARPRVGRALSIEIDEMLLAGFGAGNASETEVLQISADLFAVASVKGADRKFTLIGFNAQGELAVLSERRAPNKGELVDLRVDDQALFLTHFEPIDPPPATPVTPEPTPGAEVDAPVADRMMIRPMPQQTALKGRYFVTKISVSRRALSVSEPVNTPGRFVDLDGTRLVTLDSRVVPANEHEIDKNLDVLTVSFDTKSASLRGLLDIDDSVDAVQVRKDTAFFTSSQQANHGWGGPLPMMRSMWWGGVSNWALHIVEIRGVNLSEASNTLLERSSAGRLLDVQEVGARRFAFAAYGGGGLGVYDVTSATRPSGPTFVPANGWFNEVLVDPTRREANVWSWYHGVQTISLRP